MEGGKRPRAADEDSPPAKRAALDGDTGQPPDSESQPPAAAEGAAAVAASPASPTRPVMEEGAPQTAAPPRASDGGLGPVRPEFALPPHLALPRFAVYEIMTRVLPPGAGMESEALDAVAAAAVRFTALLATRAGEVADGRPSRGGGPGPRALKGQHASLAAAQLGFPGVARVLASMQAPRSVPEEAAAAKEAVEPAAEAKGNAGAGGGRKRKQ